MGEGLGIPQTISDVTPEWLTAALRSGGVLGTDACVTMLTIDELSAGVGFVGIVLRITPVYDGDATDAPPTIIAKMPSPDPGAREIAALYGLYEREYQFYRRLAPQISFRTARCFYAEGDAASTSYVILLEDLAGSGRIGDQITGCTLADAHKAVRALARHHAQWWGSPKLDQIGLDPGIELVRVAMEQAYPASWEVFLQRFGDQFPDDVKAMIPTLGAGMLKVMDQLSGGPFTIAHGDYRADNLFFGRDGSGYDVAVIDWQSPNKGWGAYDLAYFICGSFSADLRHAHEGELVGEYYDALVASGVSGYSREAFTTDYARSLLAYLAIFVINGATLDTANERGAELFRIIFERLNGSISDANALSYLPA